MMLFARNLVVTVNLDNSPAWWRDSIIRHLTELPGVTVSEGGRSDIHIDLEKAPVPGAWHMVLADGTPLLGGNGLLRQWATGANHCKIALMNQSGHAVRVIDVSAPASDYQTWRDNVLKAASHLPAMACRDILAGAATATAFTAQPAGMAPAPALMAAGKARQAVRRLQAKVMTEQWRIGIIDAPVSRLLDTSFTAPPVRWLSQPSRLGYHADPFAHPEHPGEIWCEFFDHQTGRGVLQQIGDEDFDHAKTINLKSGCHLSFPFMARCKGVMTLVPEMAQCGYTDIFSLDDDSRLKRICRLPVATADPILFEWEDRVWLAATRPDFDPYAGLFLWYAPSVAGPWREHSCNPVKVDVRSDRPAGTPFRHTGQLYRPAQDCAEGYGNAVAINRVITCTPTRFREEIVTVITPERLGLSGSGIHTLSAWGARTLIDEKIERVSLEGLRIKLAARARRRQG